jgi:hypothetical protein
MSLNAEPMKPRALPRPQEQDVPPCAREPEVWPSPPHDPRERIWLAELDGWQVRAFRLDGVKHRYFAPRGMLHLQLWHPVVHVSVLTPSRLTAQRYEAHPIAGWKFAYDGLRAIRNLVRSVHSVPMPSEAAIRGLERWFVDRYARAAADPARVRRAHDGSASTSCRERARGRQPSS